MIQLRSILDVADNTGAKRAAMIAVLGKKNCSNAEIGDIINVNVKESAP
ncbi:MAG: uL14 family ribosomal protein, partial [Candidatus Omnitrophica bacterium]|nr:uL14 family ribosomal protein [Candidatus Omnitrophota bacterium]